jgi:radical SAM protein with 4Fe4S-binding SPASM domain
MLHEEGEVTCALQLYELLKQPAHSNECGITAEGLACDWRGILYPCHRAVEIGNKFAIGTIYDGVDAEREKAMRATIDNLAFHSESSARFQLGSFCPVTIYQKYENFGGDWNEQFCAMINAKAKIVSKYYYDISEHIKRTKHNSIENSDEPWNSLSLEGAGRAAFLQSAPQINLGSPELAEQVARA